MIPSGMYIGLHRLAQMRRADAVARSLQHEERTKQMKTYADANRAASMPMPADKTTMISIGAQIEKLSQQLRTMQELTNDISDHLGGPLPRGISQGESGDRKLPGVLEAFGRKLDGLINGASDLHGEIGRIAGLVGLGEKGQDMVKRLDD